jgi:hypothetical protein
MSLFELKVKHKVPAVGNGRHLKTNAIAEDGFDYAVKTIEDHAMLPFSEWFCYQIAQTMGVSCPGCAILVMPDGSHAFGSRLQKDMQHMQDYIAKGQSPEDFLKNCDDRMSVIYAMDLFIANIDRHFGNFLFGTNSMGQLTVMPIDYSHAWWVGGWPLRDITSHANITNNNINILRALGLWHSAPALMALASLSQVRANTVQGWLNQMPPSWLSEADKNTLVTWWGTEEFHARVSKCISHCQP